MQVPCANCYDGTYRIWVRVKGGWEYQKQECDTCMGIGNVSSVWPRMEGLIAFHEQGEEDDRRYSWPSTGEAG